MLNLNSIMIGTMSLDTMSDFYQKVFELKPDSSEDGYFGWTVGSSYFSVYEHHKMSGSSTDPGRVMFNLETDNVEAEFNRLRDIGAVVIKEPYQMGGMWIATLADPDGNYFQLMSPWEGN